MASSRETFASSRGSPQSKVTAASKGSSRRIILEWTCSGIMMAAKQLLDTTQNPDENTIRHAIAGNLCRCTGYTKIVDAIKLAAERQQA